MKIISRTADILVVCVLLLLLATFLRILPFTNGVSEVDYATSYVIQPDQDSVFYNRLPDTLPYKVYRHLYDSARKADNEIRWSNNVTGALWYMGGIALSAGKDCNTCTTPENARDFNRRNAKSYYIGIGRFDLASRLANRPVFFRKYGKDYLKYYDSVRIQKVPTLVPAVKEVNFRYDTESKTVLFPLTKGGFIAAALLYGIFVLILIVAFLLTLGNIFKLCVSIARGIFFTAENKQRLAVAAYSLCICSLLPTVVYWAVRLCKYRDIKTWFVAAADSSGINFGWLTVAIFFWLLSKAFNRGLQLQQDHDLTV